MKSFIKKQEIFSYNPLKFYVKEAILQALALKYRPRNFGELIGQESVSQSLIRALEGGRIGHAYLFSGLRGSGKTSSARIFSKALVCEQGPTAHPCEVCAHCKAANEGRHMDIIEMDAASHRKIDDIRELIEQTKYAPAAARFKIFIIDEVHMLTKEAFNALLKTLEEPPAYVKFILATTDPLKLPATVLSRTQHFRFKQISRLNIVKHLENILKNEGIAYEKEALEILARSGSGSLRDTLTLLDQAIIYGAGDVSQNAVASMLGLLDPARVEEILEVISRADISRLKELISELEIYEPEMIIDELVANLKDKFLGGDPKFSLLIYERFFRILAQSKSLLSISGDNGFALTLMFFMMIEALNLKTIGEAIDEAKRENLAAAQDFTEQSARSARAVSSAYASPVLRPDPREISDARPALPPSVSGARPQRPTAPAPQNLGAYEIFLGKIYDRDYELGECFKHCIEFSDFDGVTMSLLSSAQGGDQAKLRANSKIVMQILRAAFGENAKIQILPKPSEQILAHSPQNSEADVKNARQDYEPAKPADVPTEISQAAKLQKVVESSQSENLGADLETEGKISDDLSFLDDELARMQNLQILNEKKPFYVEESSAQTAPSKNLSGEVQNEPAFNESGADENTNGIVSDDKTQNFSESKQKGEFDFNELRSSQDQDKMREEGVLREASRLFGEPQILKN